MFCVFNTRARVNHFAVASLSYLEVPGIIQDYVIPKGYLGKRSPDLFKTWDPVANLRFTGGELKKNALLQKKVVEALDCVKRE